MFRIRIHLIRIRIQHFLLNTDPDPIRIQGFDDQKLQKITAEKKIIFFGSITTIYLGLHKGRSSYRRSLQLSKENIQHLKTWNFVGHFCLLDPDPDSEYRSGSTGTDLIESGSETLGTVAKISTRTCPQNFLFIQRSYATFRPLWHLETPAPPPPCMFLSLQDPDPFVRGTDLAPDPSFFWNTAFLTQIWR